MYDSERPRFTPRRHDGRPTNGDASATAAPSPHQLGRSLDHPLGAMSSSDLNEDEHALKRQMLELENQIHHLSRSNAEMKEVLETEGSDPDLRGAIGENIVAIARQPATHPTAPPCMPVSEHTCTPRACRRKAILADLQEKFPNVHPAPAAATGVASQPGISL